MIEYANRTVKEPQDPAAAPRVDKLFVRHTYDPDGDTSYLEQDYNDVSEEDRAKYKQEDRKRLVAYNRGDWHFLGISAHAEVSYPIGARERRIERFQSGGIWGTEDDSEPSYLKELGVEQLDDLKSHLERFNVDTSNWDELVAQVDFHPNTHYMR